MDTPVTTRREPRRSYAPLGLVMVGLALFLAWHTGFFRSESDRSKYPRITLHYDHCVYERHHQSRNATVRQLVFDGPDGRYTLDDGVFGRHFDGPALAARLGGGGTVTAWLHPDYQHALRGIAGGKVDVPPEWGLEFDRRNQTIGLWFCSALALGGLALCAVKRRTR